MNQHPAALKWDRLYGERSQPGEPTSVLQQHLHLLPNQGLALDLACGMGANALLLARQGLDVEAWDISAVALEHLQQAAIAAGVSLQTQQRDVESHPPAANSFDVIVVSDFLYRPICPALTAALKPGGLLFYTTWNQDKVSANGPSNPDFLLQNNELLSLFAPLKIRFYQEFARCGNLAVGDHDRSHLIAQKPR